MPLQTDTIALSRPGLPRPGGEEGFQPQGQHHGGAVAVELRRVLPGVAGGPQAVGAQHCCGRGCPAPSWAGPTRASPPCSRPSPVRADTSTDGASPPTRPKLRLFFTRSLLEATNIQGLPVSSTAWSGQEGELNALLASCGRGKLLREGVPCAIVGRPNAGGPPPGSGRRGGPPPLRPGPGPAGR